MSSSIQSPLDDISSWRPTSWGFMYISISQYRYISISRYIYIDISLYLNISIYISIYQYLYIYISIYLYLYIYISISIYIYQYLSLHAHLSRLSTRFSRRRESGQVHLDPVVASVLVNAENEHTAWEWWKRWAVQPTGRECFVQKLFKMNKMPRTCWKKWLLRGFQDDKSKWSKT